jgi:hypothetical protein
MCNVVRPYAALTATQYIATLMSQLVERYCGSFYTVRTYERVDTAAAVQLCIHTLYTAYLLLHFHTAILHTLAKHCHSALKDYVKLLPRCILLKLIIQLPLIYR